MKRYFIYRHEYMAEDTYIGNMHLSLSQYCMYCCGNPTLQSLDVSIVCSSSRSRWCLIFKVNRVLVQIDGSCIFLKYFGGNRHVRLDKLWLGVGLLAPKSSSMRRGKIATVG